MSLTSPIAFAQKTVGGKPIGDYAFFKKLTSLPNVEEIYLTSSRARGDHDERSDVDLAIACPLATDADWETILRTARYNDETLLRIDAIRLDTLTDPGHRNFVLHKRQLLYLKTYGGDGIIAERKAGFFDDWHQKLTGWLNYIPKQQVQLDTEQVQQLTDAFQASVNCIWIMLRKALATHGLYVNTLLSTFHEAYAQGWIDNRLFWEQMTADYHLTKHPMTAKSFEDFHLRTPSYIEAINNAANRLLTHIKPYIYEHAAI
jgi:predicted nucleotidyltransferase